MEFINFINEKVINTNMECSTKEEFFQQVHDKVFALGYVTEDFYKKILEREGIFPTALNLGEYGVAIPHTDAEYIKEEFISICTFKDSIELSSMEDQNEKVSVKLAFVLGLNQPHNQLKVLTELMSIIQNKELVEALINSSNAEDVLGIVKSLEQQSTQQA